MRRIGFLLGAVALLLGVALPAAGQGGVGAGDYRIGPRDLLEFQVVEVPQLNVERRVSADGTVSLPLVGDVEVAGLTESEIRVKLKTLLESKYLQSQAASVSVFIKELRARPITVLGAVGKPGPLAFPGRWTLLEALTAAGGLAGEHGEVIHVLRRASNGLTDQITIPIQELLYRGDPKVNIPIYANDLINVPGAVPVTVFLIGEVQSPGAIVFKSTDRITVLTALARAGGLSDRAARKVIIRRQLPGGKDQEITVDAKAILAGGEPDVELRPGDVMVVKESFF